MKVEKQQAAAGAVTYLWGRVDLGRDLDPRGSTYSGCTCHLGSWSAAVPHVLLGNNPWPDPARNYFVISVKCRQNE